MPINSFPYAPMNGSEIRYITIHAFDDSIGRVQCTLHQAPLGDVHFTALSYAWGDPDVTETILLSGTPFDLTTNLEACLRKFATNSKTHELNLWVDAICINQADVDERSAQVWRMKDIYPAAESVKAWLGPSTPLSRVGMQRLRDIPISVVENLQRNAILKMDPEITKPVITQALEGDGAEGLRDLFLRPYWQRAWVVQELFLGKDIDMVCGKDEVPSDRFDVWHDLYIKHGHWSTDPWPLNSHLPDAPRILRASSALRSLPSLLWDTKDLLCSDERDKVYSLLGMIESWESEAIVPDYVRPVLKIYGDVVQAQIEKYDDLEVLQFGRYNPRWDSSHPSWIPDWRNGHGNNRPVSFSTQYYGYKYPTSKRLPLSSYPWKLDRDNERLYLFGAKLDTITTISRSEFYLSDNENYSDLDIATEWIEMVYKVLAPASPEAASGSDRSMDSDVPRYPLNDNEPLARACRRTLVSDYCLFTEPEKRRSYQFLFPDDEDEQRPDGSVYGHLDTAFYLHDEITSRKMAITSKGWVGLVVEEAEVGDHVAVVIGASMPLILRDAPADEAVGGEKGHVEEYRLIGHSYIHGLMDGRGLDMAEMGEIIIR